MKRSADDIASIHLNPVPIKISQSMLYTIEGAMDIFGLTIEEILQDAVHNHAKLLEKEIRDDLVRRMEQMEAMEAFDHVDPPTPEEAAASAERERRNAEALDRYIEQLETNDGKGWDNYEDFDNKDQGGQHE